MGFCQNQKIIKIKSIELKKARQKIIKSKKITQKTLKPKVRKFKTRKLKAWRIEPILTIRGELRRLQICPWGYKLLLVPLIRRFLKPIHLFGGLFGMIQIH